MPNVEIHRRLGERDISAIVELVQAAESVDKHKALEDHAWIDLVQGGRKGVLGLVAKSIHTDAVIGYAQISKGSNNSWAVEYVIHPKNRDNQEIAKELLSQAFAEIQRQGGGHIHLWIAKPPPSTDKLCADIGLQKGRTLYQMRRTLPLETSLQEPSITTRPFVIGQDEEAWLKLNNDAFSWHPEQGDWDLATIHSREAESWFDPDGFLLYEIEGELAAFCWTKIHTHVDHNLGEIYVIAVDPKRRGQKLGKLMCVAGLNYLAEKGLSVAMLYVESTNKSALKLYEHLGFSVDHIDRAYVTDLSPARNL